MAFLDASYPQSVEPAMWRRLDACQDSASSDLPESEPPAEPESPPAPEEPDRELFAAEAERILADARQEADRLRAEAQSEAAQLRAAAESAAEQLRSIAAEEAERLRQEARALRDQAAAALAEAEQVRASARSDAEKQAAAAVRQALLNADAQVLELVLALGEQLARQTLGHDAEALLPLITESLQRLGEGDWRIAVAPSQAEAVAGHLGVLRQGLSAGARVSVEPDPALIPGDFIVSGDGGWIDGRLEQQMQVLRDALAEEREVLHGATGDRAMPGGSSGP